MVYMENLIIIKSEMDMREITRAAFNFNINEKPFSCIFIIDITPFRFYLTTLGNEPYVIEFEVSNNFEINPILSKEDYTALIRYLEIKYNPDNKFSTIKFLNDINAILPTVIINNPHYTDILKTVSKTREVEESNKIYFMGWKKLHDGQNVSPQNAEKTLSVFGEKIAKLSVSSGISSCWTDQPNLAISLNTLPF